MLDEQGLNADNGRKAFAVHRRPRLKGIEFTRIRVSDDADRNQITEIARILSVNPLMTLVNLIFLFPWYSKHVSLRFISIISSGCWLLPAAFFPIAAFFATHPAPSLGWWLIYALWFVGHVGGMTWWT